MGSVTSCRFTQWHLPPRVYRSGAISPGGISGNEHMQSILVTSYGKSVCDPLIRHENVLCRSIVALSRQNEIFNREQRLLGRKRDHRSKSILATDKAVERLDGWDAHPRFSHVRRHQQDGDWLDGVDCRVSHSRVDGGGKSCFKGK